MKRLAAAVLGLATLGCGGMFYAPVTLTPVATDCGLLTLDATREADWANSVPLRVDGETVDLLAFDASDTVRVRVALPPGPHDVRAGSGGTVSVTVEPSDLEVTWRLHHDGRRSAVLVGLEGTCAAHAATLYVKVDDEVVEVPAQPGKRQVPLRGLSRGPHDVVFTVLSAERETLFHERRDEG